MLTHYTHAMRNYAILRGRASRAEFWSFYAVYMLMAIAVALLDQSYFGTLREESGIITLLFGAVHSLPGIAVQVRRLHDISRSGWWILVNLTGIGILAMLIVAMLRGTDGPNHFGPEPGNIDEDDGLHRRMAGRADRAVQHLHDDRTEPREPSIDRHAVDPVVPHSAPTASVRSPADLIGDLERLAALRQNGGLTEAEFEVMKAQTLSRGFDR